MNRKPNLDMKIVAGIEKSIGLSFVPEEDNGEIPASAGMTSTFAPVDVMDYIYGVLHTPSYREKYKEFLKIDFPRVPYPTSADNFWTIGKLGAELRQLHLMESPILSKFITAYPIEGDNIVEKIKYDDGKVYINKEQYFDGVSQEVWDFYVGGYRVADKWLKDRKKTELTFDDITHYQRIIVSLAETIRVMNELDKLAK